MDVPLELAFHNMESDAELEDQIRAHAEGLDTRFKRLRSCRVVVEVSARSQAQALEHHVRVEVGVPGRKLVASRDPGAHDRRFDPSMAINDAFAAVERQLEQDQEEARGEVKAHDAPLQGRIRSTFPDHGFIDTNDGREVFFHRNSVVGAKFEDLAEGETVELSVAPGEGPAGTQATTVKPISAMKYDPGAEAPADR